MNLPLGKVPPDALVDVVFKHLGERRVDVVIGPSHGEDAAIVRVGHHLLALSSDPISGALDRIGTLAVNVATNDIATRGVRPSWLLSNILLPEGSDARVLSVICRQMGRAAKELRVAIVGGHAEVTPGLDHPVIVALASGVVGKKGYISCSDAKPGGRIILTKGAAIEGTAILAADRSEILSKIYGARLVRTARRFFEMTSVVEDAIISFDTGHVQAMHDPTEGGVAGGLNELANASRTGFRVYEESINIEPETELICRHFGINPLRLIGSGSLLIAVDRNHEDTVISKLKTRRTKATVIGEILREKSKRILVKRNGAETRLPLPKADDLWTALRKRT